MRFPLAIKDNYRSSSCYYRVIVKPSQFIYLNQHNVLLN